jgi:hypothetical protein
VLESAVQWLMPELSRRRYPEARDECWHVYYGDVHVGTLAIRSGNPHDTPAWEWRCGFYPGSQPGECRSGTAASLDEARAEFEAAYSAHALSVSVRVDPTQNTGNTEVRF